MKRKYEIKLSNLSKNDFISTLNYLNLNRRELSIKMGLSYQTVKSWYSNNHMPMYAEKFLENLVKLKKYENTYEEIENLKGILNKLKFNI